MAPSIPTVLLSSLLVSSPLLARAALVEHWWDITYATANPAALSPAPYDGMEPRRVLGVNGTWPPPVVEVTQNDTLRIHVRNLIGVDDVDASDLLFGPTIGTGIHTHGNFFNTTSYYDGAMQVTQCPIPTNQSMTYEIPTSDQTGTYWIHGHYQGQYVDGLRTPFIIHPLPTLARTDITWDEEYTIIAGDWYQRQWRDLMDNVFFRWQNPTGAEPVPNSAVIYAAANGTYVNTPAELAAGKGVNDDAVLKFEPGKKYRIRLINMSALSMFYIQIAGHKMSVIEMDGTEVEPFELDLLSMSVAQRYSILVEARNETDANYAITFSQNIDMYDVLPEDLVLDNAVTISYNDANPAVEPQVWTEEVYPMLDDTQFVPIKKIKMAEADESIELIITFDTYDNGEPRAAFNDITYTMPSTPSLYTAMSMGADANNSKIYGQMTYPVILEHNKNYELKLVNTDTGNHPFHLHGHEFQVVGRSMDYTAPDVVVEGQANPARRDTVMVPGEGWTAVRFRADNPGVWIFHCHVEWHMNQGLAMTFISAPELIQQSHKIPQYMLDQCAASGMSSTGNAVGRNSTTDLAGEAYGPWPQVLGWTPRAKGAMAGCVISALAGFAAIVWYGWGELDESEIEEEIRRKQEAKELKKQQGNFFQRMTKK